MYATLAAARAAGATGTDADVTAALAAARVLIDRFTREWWEPTDATLSVRVGPDGFAPLPRRVQRVDSVTEQGASTPLAPDAYTVTSSTTLGDVDAILLRSWGADPLIAGAEPWRGGYANLTGRLASRRLNVTGSFGQAAPDPVVSTAAAQLAAWISNGGRPTLAPGPLDVDTEGNTVSITVPDEPEPRVRSTGLREVDAALSGLLGSGRMLVS